MKNAILMTLMLAALGPKALGANAMPMMIDSDPLSRQILKKTALENGGVTAAVGLASGQVIELKLTDVSSAPFPSAMLAPAATASTLALKPASGLMPKAAKSKTRKPARRAVDQLKRVKKSWDEAR